MWDLYFSTLQNWIGKNWKLIRQTFITRTLNISIKLYQKAISREDVLLMKDNRLCLKFSFEKSNLYVKNFVLKICLMSCSGQALHKKWSFPLRKSSVNVVRGKLRVWSYLLKKSLLENFIFCAVWYHSISRMKKFLIKKLQHI